MKELVVVSGKGGTGKTSVVGGLATLASADGRVVLADCDVDAADLHLILGPQVHRREDFTASEVAVVDPGKCTGCGKCVDMCRFDAIALFDGVAAVDPIACEGCGVCAHFCPEGAISMHPRVSGEWFVSDTRAGTMVHARLGIAESNSGKLVSVIRRRAREIAEEERAEWVIVDGPPGIGCPVIASITGASALLVVSEPTPSGLHDLERVLKLASHFDVSSMVCVNKSDINPDVASRIEVKAEELGAVVLRRIPYDPDVTRCQVAGKTLVEDSNGPAAEAVRRIWEDLTGRLAGS